MDAMSTRIEERIRQNELLTVSEVARYLRVSQVTVWRWCRKGIVPASRIGRTWRIHHDDLLRLVNSYKPDQRLVIAPLSPLEPQIDN